MIRVSCLASIICLTTQAATAQIAVPQPPINCTINPVQTVELSTSIAGIVEQVLVRPGDRIETGEVVARLDTELAEADLLLARTRADFAGAIRAAELQRDSLSSRVNMLEQAIESNAVSRIEYESALLEYELSIATVAQQRQDQLLAQQEVARARAILEKAIINSPVNGIVGEDLIDVGENVLNRPVATIYVTHPMRVEAFVPVALLKKIAEYPDPEIVVDGDRQNPVSVTLDYISPVANLSSNTISIYFTLESDTIIPGYKCTLAQIN